MDANRVPIVDDVEAFCEIGRSVFMAAGFGVDRANDAAQAPVTIPQCLPDGILMDSQRPAVDGIKMTRQLKAAPASRDLVGVAVTACAAKGDTRKLRAAGFNGCSAKPVGAMLLTAEVRFWWDGPDSARGSHFVWP